ncbi:MAG: MerR family DNA-binding transcriptional regulator [Sedimenticola sp.]
MNSNNCGAAQAEEYNDMKDTTYSISELAKEFDVTPRAIRFYEDQSLITPTRKGRCRIYSERDRIRLKLVLRGKRIGFSLAEIKTVFDMYDSEPGEEGQLTYLIDMIRDRSNMLKLQRRDIDAVLQDMKDVEKRAKTALKALQKN